MSEKQKIIRKDEITAIREEIQNIALSEAETRTELEVQSQVLLARRFPRKEGEIREKVLKICKNKNFALKALYSYPRGGTMIVGPSINLAVSLGRLWGNLLSGLQIIYDDEETRTIRGTVWDIETNNKFYYEDTFKKLIYRKDKGYIVPEERELRELTFRRGSILMRNAILRVLPPDLIEEAIEACKRTLASKRVSIDWGKIVEAFKNIGVSREAIEAKLGHKIEEITEEERVELLGIYNSIKDGQAKIEEIFSPSNNKEIIEVEKIEGLEAVNENK